MDDNRSQDENAVAVEKENEVNALLDSITSRIHAIQFCVESMLQRIEIEEE